MTTWSEVLDKVSDEGAWGSVWRCGCGGVRVLDAKSIWWNMCRCGGDSQRVDPIGVVEGELVVVDEESA